MARRFSNIRLLMRPSELDIRIVKIAELPGKCHINRWEMMRYSSNPEDISVDLHARLDTDSSSDVITLRLGAVYTYMRAMVKRPLLDYTVEAEFEIPGIENFINFSQNREVVDIPPSVMSLMLSVAVGALRGMIAQKTVGTTLEHRPLPLVNLSNLVSRLIYGSKPKEPTIPMGSSVIV